MIKSNLLRSEETKQAREGLFFVIVEIVVS